MTALRDIERNSLRAFVQRAADLGYLSGRVLDYGCGKQPYRDIVEEAGGTYFGFDRVAYPANVSGEDIGEENVDWEADWDAILCTQVLQYVERPGELLGWFYRILKQYGHLVLTYPTTWPEVELEDLHRFTQQGMRKMLGDAFFIIGLHECRAMVPIVGGEMVSLGYGVIARS